MCVVEEKAAVSEAQEDDEGNFEDARDGDSDSGGMDDEHLMVIETPEGLTLLEHSENSSFYFVQENEGLETPPGNIVIYM